MNRNEVLKTAKAVIYCKLYGGEDECMKRDGCEGCPGNHSDMKEKEALEWLVKHVKED